MSKENLLDSIAKTIVIIATLGIFCLLLFEIPTLMVGAFVVLIVAWASERMCVKIEGS